MMMMMMMYSVSHGETVTEERQRNDGNRPSITPEARALTNCKTTALCYSW